MIRWAYISLFIGLMLFKPVSQFSWEVWYLSNYEFVSEELCENTEEPELQCNGKCFLGKQLEKAEIEKNDSHDEQPVPPFQTGEEVLCSAISPVTIVTEFFQADVQHSFQEPNAHLQSALLDVFHPPQV